MPESIFLFALILRDFAHFLIGMEIKITLASTIAIRVADICPYKNAKSAMHGIAGTDIARKTSRSKSFLFNIALEA